MTRRMWLIPKKMKWSSASSLIATGPHAPWDHVATDGAGGMLDAELGKELSSDPVLALLGVVPRDALDEADVFAWDAGSADLRRVRLTPPQELEAAAVPTDNRGWFYDNQRVGPARPQSTEGDPEEAAPAWSPTRL